MKEEVSYGGQAAIEGVMMRGSKVMALAVRKPDGEVVVTTRPLKSVATYWKVLRLPFIRGTLILVESLLLGIEALMESANYFLDDEGERLNTREIVLTVILGFALSVGLFIVLPTFLIRYLVEGIVEGPLLLNLIEGAIRIGIFLLYIFLISRIKDIGRVFEYHGAEHRAIHTYEAGEELNVENASKHSTMHPRCGTSFLLVVMVVSILVFSLLGEQALLMRIVSRILLIPVVTGISYEIIKLAGKKRSKIMEWVIAPGMWLQALTTREPDAAQMEVALIALREVLTAEGRLIPRTLTNVSQAPRE